MKRKIKIHEDFKKSEADLLNLIDQFSTSGKFIADGGRNTIKSFNLNGEKVAIKSFKKPGFINKIIYAYFRKSKAQRSYEYARILEQNNLGTPQPVAYVCEFDFLGLTKSYYVCKNINADLTYRELVQEPNFPNHETILRHFVHFTHSLHENNILFKDHSPGNTLIKKSTENNYSFYLVDLNRMTFNALSFEERIKNFSRLTPKKEMVAVMSDEYAKITGLDYQNVFNKMWQQTSRFQEKFFRKRRFKKRFFFWRK